MKYLFGVKDNKGFAEGNILDKMTIKSIEQEKGERFNELKEECRKLEKKARPLFLMRYIWIFFGIGLIFIFRSILSSEKFLETRNLVIFISGIVLLAIGVLVMFLNHMKGKKFINSEDKAAIEKKINDFYIDCQLDLGVPADSKKIDYFFLPFESSENPKKKHSKFVSNQELSTFVKGENVCLSDIMQVIGFPLKSIYEIVKVNRTVYLTTWNKKESFRSEKYKEYGIRLTSLGLYLKYVYSVRIHAFEDDYEFYIAPYDLDDFLNLTNFVYDGKEEDDIPEIEESDDKKEEDIPKEEQTENIEEKEE